MRGIDYVGLILIGAVGIGGAVYFVKSRPIEPQGYAQPGIPIPVVPQGQNFIVAPNQQAGSTTGQDAVGVINALGNLSTSLFGAGGVGKLF